MANVEQLFDQRQRKRLRRRSTYEKITENGTISAAVMVLAAVLAVFCANTDAYEPIHHFLMSPISVSLGSLTASMTIELFINDFLMAIFFLLVGIELKYEMTVGELRRPRQAMLPMVAAIGGVAIPALIYLVINRGGAVNGWAVPMATDIAFALGVMSLLGNRVPAGVRVFFSTLAIADDLIAIAAIALFYGESPDLLWLCGAAVAVFALILLNRTQHMRLAPYILVGLVLWFCLFQSGIHATLAGVILALCIPGGSSMQLEKLPGWLEEVAPALDESFDEESHVLGQHEFTHAASDVEKIMHQVTPPLIRLEHCISTPVNFVILPIFAFANAQVRLVGVDLMALAMDPVAIGVYVGMLVGKPTGIFGVTLIMVKTGISKLPERVSLGHIAGVGVLGAIGFTMSILISGLAFTTEPFDLLAAKAAILAGSVTAALLGLAVMRFAAKKPAAEG
ncbi:MAG: Na+/H+ antiporter NhaA [Coriobacteriaceae bacterium]|nr:Na+/H+ antiporter NhaA [Coriobacteriaceae bacterium]